MLYEDILISIVENLKYYTKIKGAPSCTMPLFGAGFNHHDGGRGLRKPPSRIVSEGLYTPEDDLTTITLHLPTFQLSTFQNFGTFPPFFPARPVTCKQ